MKLSNLLLTSLIASSITSSCVAQKEKNKAPKKELSKVEKDNIDIIYPPSIEAFKTSEKTKNTISKPISKTFLNKPIIAIKQTKRRPRKNCPACGKG